MRHHERLTMTSSEPIALQKPTEAALARPGTLRAKVISASAWTVSEMFAGRALRLGSNLIMTRLLFPEAFGMMAVVNVYLYGMQLLSDLGLGPSIIHDRRGDEPGFLNTAWTLQIIRGAFISLMLALCAWPLAIFYGQPLLGWLIAVAGLAAIFSGLESTAQFTLRKHLQFKQLTLMTVGSQTIGIAVMIALALIYQSVWALIGGMLIGAAVRTVWSHLLIPGQHNRLQWDRQAASAVIRFGKWIFLSSALGFLAGQLDRMMLPKFIPLDLMGIYGIAVMLAAAPDELVSHLSYQVMFPTLSKLNHLPNEQLLEKFRPARGKLLLAMAVGAGLLASLGDVVVRLLYDNRYHDAAWILAILALGLWPKLVANTGGAALLAIGQSRFFALASAVQTTVIAVGLPLGYYLGGLPGVLAVVALANFSGYVMESYGLWRNRLWLPWQDVQATALWMTVIAAVFLIRGNVPWNP